MSEEIFRSSEDFFRVHRDVTIHSGTVAPMAGDRIDETGQRIMRAALRRFVDVGYGSATVDEIAAEAGVGVATLYRRWPDKAALANDLVAEHLAAFEAMNEPVQGGTAKQRFLTLWRRMFDLITDDPERFVFAEAHMYAAFVTEENAARKAEVFETSGAVLTDLGIGADLEVASALLNGTAIQLARHGLDVDPDDLGERLWAALRPTIG